MTLGTPLSNVALHFPSSYLSCVLATVLLGVTLRGAHSSDPEGELPPPPLPSQGGSLDAWANSAAGLAVDFCIDREADSAAYAICKQNVMTDSSICSKQLLDGTSGSFLRYEACMDGSLFKSPCAKKTHDRFWKEALDQAQSKVPAAWSKGWHCKDKNRTEDVVFNSFWDALCQRNGSAACFPEKKKKATSNLLHVSSQHGADHKKEVYRQWLRNRFPHVTGVSRDCQESLPSVKSPLAALQLEMSTSAKTQMSAGGTAGFKLHHRRERVHIWSKPCRKLPLAQRPACERKVDAEVLNDKTWVPLRGARREAFTVQLDHD